MNTFQFEDYNSPIVSPWTEDNIFCDDGDSSSVLSFLKGQDEILEQRQPNVSFGYDWLVDADENNFLQECNFFNKMDDKFLKKGRAHSLHFNVSALEGLVSHSMKNDSHEDETSSVQLKKSIKKAPKRTYTKALSVKSTKARVSKKAKLVKKVKKTKPKSTKKNKSKDFKIEILDNCSTLSCSKKSQSQSIASKSTYQEFSDIQELTDLLKADVESTFKLNQKSGLVSNIPQIFSSNLFSKENKAQQEDTSMFMAASLLRNENSTA